MEIPKYLKKYINDEGIKNIEQAILDVEKETSAELVPVVVEQSSTTGHVYGFLLLFFTLIVMTFDFQSIQEKYLGLGNYGYIFHVLFVFLHVTFLGRSQRVKRLLTPKEDQDYQVEQRALLEFYKSNIKKTRESTGILFFVSILEKKAIVLADEAISEKLPENTWDTIVGIMVSGIKGNDLSRGFEKGIRSSGNMLKQLFPIRPDDENELPNKLIIR